MATTMLPEVPAPNPSYGGEVLRNPMVSANLLPSEVVDARNAKKLQKRVLMSLAALLVLLVALYGLSIWGTSRTKGQLADAQVHSVSLQNKQRAYAPLVNAQRQADTISKQLSALMLGDLQWKDMLATLRASAHGGVIVIGVTGNLSVGVGVTTGQSVGASGPGLGALNQSGSQVVGTLVIAGTAPDKNSVAAYADTLSAVKGLAAPFVASVTQVGGRVTFTVNSLVTTAALGGRFTQPTTSTGGH